jgi:hypothetical protein
MSFQPKASYTLPFSPKQENPEIPAVSSLGFMEWMHAAALGSSRMFPYSRLAPGTKTW